MITSNRMPTLLAALAVLGVGAPNVLAQNGRPRPAEPLPTLVETRDETPNRDAGPIRPAPAQFERDSIDESDAGDEVEATDGDSRSAARNRARTNGTPNGRRAAPDDMIPFQLDDVSIEETFKFIVDSTGKVVIPVGLSSLRQTKITLMCDDLVPRKRALDLLLDAFRLNQIGVIEKEEVMILGPLTDVANLGLPVLGPEDDVMYRMDTGTFVIKIFKLNKRDAESVSEQLEEHLPDYASLTFDPNSNQIVVTGDIALCQQFQLIIDELDNNYINVKTETFRLRYADASEIAENIEDLFDMTGSAASSGQRTSSRTSRRNARNSRRSGGSNTANAAAATVGPGPIAEMRLTVNVQQNTVTVQSDPDIMKEISKLVFEYWDLPRPEGTSKLYLLDYTDPMKVQLVLESVLESGGTSTRTTRPGRSGGSSSSGGATAAVSGIYQLEAYPDTNSLLVMCKTEDSFAYLDSIVNAIDQPSIVGMPSIVELRYADAVDVANELNVLFAPAGTQVSMDAPDRGLSGSGLDSDAGGASGATGREAEQGSEIRFPWQSGRQDENQSPETPLIGRTRIVPIVRQNALAIVAPPQYQERVQEMIEFFDRPGRQVMISAIIAEVELNDDFSLGLRVSREGIPQTNLDNSIGASLSGSGSEDDIFDGWFNTSTLGLDFNANAAIQALDQKTNVRVLQEPRVFTSDGQEAFFFDGQDIPFVTDSFSNNTGGLTQGFEYRQVGVILNCRPRITAERDVELELYLELSSIVPGQTLFGGAIVDRRSTTTEVVVKDGQTIVLSGILNDEESQIIRKLPGLGDLPLIGGLFTSSERRNTTTELVAFITPTVVGHPSENSIPGSPNQMDVGRLQEFKDLDIDRRKHPKMRQDLRDRMIDGPRKVPLMDPESQVFDRTGDGE